jgi:hypothetical protein
MVASIASYSRTDLSGAEAGTMAENRGRMDPTERRDHGKRFKLSFSITELMAIVGMFALALVAAWPVVERASIPPSEARALFFIDHAPLHAGDSIEDIRISVEDIVNNGRDYLRSAAAIKEIPDDPRVMSGPSRPSSDDLKRIRVAVFPGTSDLVQCSLEVKDPARDTALLKRAASAMFNSAIVSTPMLRSPGGTARIRCVSQAVAPRVPALRRHRDFLFFAYCSLIFLLSLAAIAIRPPFRPKRGEPFSLRT